MIMEKYRALMRSHENISELIILAGDEASRIGIAEMLRRDPAVKFSGDDSQCQAVLESLLSRIKREMGSLIDYVKDPDRWRHERAQRQYIENELEINTITRRIKRLDEQYKERELVVIPREKMEEIFNKLFEYGEFMKEYAPEEIQGTYSEKDYMGWLQQKYDELELKKIFNADLNDRFQNTAEIRLQGFRKTVTLADSGWADDSNWEWLAEQTMQLTQIANDIASYQGAATAALRELSRADENRTIERENELYQFMRLSHVFWIIGEQYSQIARVDPLIEKLTKHITQPVIISITE